MFNFYAGHLIEIFGNCNFTDHEAKTLWNFGIRCQWDYFYHWLSCFTDNKCCTACCLIHQTDQLTFSDKGEKSSVIIRYFGNIKKFRKAVENQWAVGSWQLAVGSWLLAVGSWQLAVNMVKILWKHRSPRFAGFLCCAEREGFEPSIAL